MKTTRILKTEWLQIVFLALPFALAAVYWAKFPVRVATHWNIHGHANGWMGKEVGLLLLPVINVGICAFMFCLPRLDPKIRASSGDHKRTVSVLRTWRLVATGFFSFMSLLILAVAAGIPIDMNRAVVNGALAMFLMLGNFLGNLRPNYFAGIRTPWTLDDPEVWRATHRVGGRLMVCGSLLLLSLQFFLNGEQLLEGFLACLVSFAAWSMGYSYYLFLRKSR